VTFDIDTSCDSYLTAVDSAIDAAATVWESVPSAKITIQRGSSVSLPSSITTYVGSSATSYAPTGNAIVYCDSNFASDTGLSASSIPGVAASANMSSSGQIQGVLLVLNVQSGATASITNLSTDEVKTVLTHEIGHCLGLGHSSDYNALMYYSTNSTRQAVLAKDDIDGLTYLYPNQQLGTSVLGCSALSTVSVKDLDDKNDPFGGRSHSRPPMNLLRSLHPISLDLLLFIGFLALLQLYKLKRKITF
jgi:hypothetical protein